MINKIFNILFFPKPKPEGTGAGGRTVEKSGTGRGTNYGMYVLIAIVAVALLAGINYAISQPANVQPAATTLSSSGGSPGGGNGQQVINAFQAEKPTGTATPTQNGKETIEIPADTLKIGASTINEFPINNYPKNFLTTRGNILYTNVNIGITEISGIVSIPDEKKTKNSGGAGGFSLLFYKDEKYLGGINILAPITGNAKTAQFSVKRNPETLGANKIQIEAK